LIRIQILNTGEDSNDSLSEHIILVVNKCHICEPADAHEHSQEEDQTEVLTVDPEKLGLEESYGEFSAKYRSFHQQQQHQVDSAR
jgi:hypothetical protein